MSGGDVGNGEPRRDGITPLEEAKDLQLDYVMLVDPNAVQYNLSNCETIPVNTAISTISVPRDDEAFADATSRYMSQAELSPDETNRDTSLFWRHVTDSITDGNSSSGCSRKVLKSCRRSDASSTCTSSQQDTDDEDEDDVKPSLVPPDSTVGLCSSPSQFVFVNGQPGFTGTICQPPVENGASPIARQSDSTSSAVSSSLSPAEPNQCATVQDNDTSLTNRTSTLSLHSVRSAHKGPKAAFATTGRPKADGYELCILQQPESQHRARYLTEGSRGAIKDSSQEGHPVVQLLGYDKEVVLQIYIGNDAGKVRPHTFYQACRVSVRNGLASSEKIVNGTNVIEVLLSPEHIMTASIDCVGILKLRNADVEKRIGDAPNRCKKRSTRTRLIFRVDIPKDDGSTLTLQVASTPISCTQPPGQPEVSTMSLHEASVTGGQQLFVIGKNFSKTPSVIFQRRQADLIVWSQQATLLQQYVTPIHLVCIVPAYEKEIVTESFDVDVFIESNGNASEPTSFTYLPVRKDLKIEAVPMEIDPTPLSTNKHISVSPEAVALNKLFEKNYRAVSNAGSEHHTLTRPLMSSEATEDRSVENTPAKRARDTTDSNIHNAKQQVTTEVQQRYACKPYTSQDNVELRMVQELMDKADAANQQKITNSKTDYKTDQKSEHVLHTSNALNTPQLLAMKTWPAAATEQHETSPGLRAEPTVGLRDLLQQPNTALKLAQQMDKSQKRDEPRMYPPNVEVGSSINVSEPSVVTPVPVLSFVQSATDNLTVLAYGQIAPTIGLKPQPSTAATTVGQTTPTAQVKMATESVIPVVGQLPSGQIASGQMASTQLLSGQMTSAHLISGQMVPSTFGQTVALPSQPTVFVPSLIQTVPMTTVVSQSYVTSPKSTQVAFHLPPSSVTAAVFSQPATAPIADRPFVITPTFGHFVGTVNTFSQPVETTKSVSSVFSQPPTTTNVFVQPVVNNSPLSQSSATTNTFVQPVINNSALSLPSATTNTFVPSVINNSALSPPSAGTHTFVLPVLSDSMFSQSSATTNTFLQPAMNNSLFSQSSVTTNTFGQPVMATPTIGSQVIASAMGQPVMTTPSLHQSAGITPTFGQPLSTIPVTAVASQSVTAVPAFIHSVMPMQSFTHGSSNQLMNHASTSAISESTVQNAVSSQPDNLTDTSKMQVVFVQNNSVTSDLMTTLWKEPPPETATVSETLAQSSDMLGDASTQVDDTRQKTYTKNSEVAEKLSEVQNLAKIIQSKPIPEKKDVEETSAESIAKEAAHDANKVMEKLSELQDIASWLQSPTSKESTDKRSSIDADKRNFFVIDSTPNAHEAQEALLHRKSVEIILPQDKQGTVQDTTNFTTDLSHNYNECEQPMSIEGFTAPDMAMNTSQYGSLTSLEDVTMTVHMSQPAKVSDHVLMTAPSEKMATDTTPYKQQEFQSMQQPLQGKQEQNHLQQQLEQLHQQQLHTHLQQQATVQQQLEILQQLEQQHPEQQAQHLQLQQHVSEQNVQQQQHALHREEDVQTELQQKLQQKTEELKQQKQLQQQLQQQAGQQTQPAVQWQQRQEILQHQTTHQELQQQNSQLSQQLSQQQTPQHQQQQNAEQQLLQQQTQQQQQQHLQHAQQLQHQTSHEQLLQQVPQLQQQTPQLKQQTPQLQQQALQTPQLQQQMQQLQQVPQLQQQAQHLQQIPQVHQQTQLQQQTQQLLQQQVPQLQVPQLQQQAQLQQQTTQQLLQQHIQEQLLQQTEKLQQIPFDSRPLQQLTEQQLMHQQQQQQQRQNDSQQQQINHEAQQQQMQQQTPHEAPQQQGQLQQQQGQIQQQIPHEAQQNQMQQQIHHEVQQQQGKMQQQIQEAQQMQQQIHHEVQQQQGQLQQQIQHEAQKQQMQQQIHHEVQQQQGKMQQQIQEAQQQQMQQQIHHEVQQQQGQLQQQIQHEAQKQQMQQQIHHEVQQQQGQLQQQIQHEAQKQQMQQQQIHHEVQQQQGKMQQQIQHEAQKQQMQQQIHHEVQQQQGKTQQQTQHEAQQQQQTHETQQQQGQMQQQQQQHHSESPFEMPASLMLHIDACSEKQTSIVSSLTSSKHNGSNIPGENFVLSPALQSTTGSEGHNVPQDTPTQFANSSTSQLSETTTSRPQTALPTISLDDVVRILDNPEPSNATGQ